MTVADLGSDFLWARCPNGHNSVQLIQAYLERRHPPQTRLAAIIARMVCKRCGARAVGELEGYTRSGAEGPGA
jgi:hypothetical protein